MLASRLKAKLTFAYIEHRQSKEIIAQAADTFAMALKAVEVGGRMQMSEAERYAIEALETAEVKYADMDDDTFRDYLRCLYD